MGIPDRASREVGAGAPGAVAPPRDGAAVDGRDAALAALVALAFAAVYALSWQEHASGDGGLLYFWALQGKTTGFRHVLYLPLAHLLAPLASEARPILHLQVASVLPAALAVGLAHPLARLLGATRSRALFAAVLAGATPVVWFNATRIELHALQLLGVVAAALAIELLPWRRRAPSLAAATLVLALPIAAHLSNVLVGLGLVLLVGHAARRAGRPFGARALLLGVGPLFLAAELACVWLVERLAGGGGTGTVELGEYVARWRDEFGAREDEGPSLLRASWLEPLAWLLVPAAIGLAREGARGARAAELGALLPFAIFLLWWNAREHGSYSLGALAFLVTLAARGGAALPPVVLVLLLALQGASGLAYVRVHDRGVGLVQRIRAVRAVATEPARFAGASLTAWRASPIGALAPGAEEHDLRPALLEAIVSGEPAAAFAERALREVEEAADGALCVIDEGSLRAHLGAIARELPPDHPDVARAGELIDALVRAALERPGARRRDHPEWPMIAYRPGAG